MTSQNRKVPHEHRKDILMDDLEYNEHVICLDNILIIVCKSYDQKLCSNQ